MKTAPTIDSPTFPDRPTGRANIDSMSIEEMERYSNLVNDDIQALSDRAAAATQIRSPNNSGYEAAIDEAFDRVKMLFEAAESEKGPKLERCEFNEANPPPQLTRETKVAWKLRIKSLADQNATLERLIEIEMKKNKDLKAKALKAGIKIE